MFSSDSVIAQGVVGLLPRSWHGRVRVAETLGALRDALRRPTAITIVDCGSLLAEEAARTARMAGTAVLMLLNTVDPVLDLRLLEVADGGILLRDEVGPRSLLLALEAILLGLRVAPRSLRLAPPQLEVAPAPIPEMGWQALRMLADGLRDADIARELSLSESAVRKLLARTVQGLGATTRCQAVARATLQGRLT